MPFDPFTAGGGEGTESGHGSPMETDGGEDPGDEVINVGLHEHCIIVLNLHDVRMFNSSIYTVHSRHHS